jgi:Tol biopolymer transport system component
MFWQPALSPDETTILAPRVDPVTQVQDLWSIQSESGLGQRLTHGNFGFMPIWSPDGRQIVFSSERGGLPPNLFLTTLSASGDEQRLFESRDLLHPTDWSRDGRFVVYAAQTPSWDLMRLPMTGPASERRPEALRATAFNEHFGRVSPNGRWLAYASDASDAFEVYVRPFDGEDAGQRISINGGVEPSWRADGAEIYYVTLDGILMAVSLTANDTSILQPGQPRPVFRSDGPRIARSGQFATTYRVSKDGRFLLSVLDGDIRTTPTKVMFNWTSALRRD